MCPCFAATIDAEIHRSDFFAQKVERAKKSKEIGAKFFFKFASFSSAANEKKLKINFLSMPIFSLLELLLL